MGSNPNQEDFFFSSSVLFILLHGNAPVICKCGLHAQKIAETMPFFLPFTALLKTFEDKRKSIATLFFFFCPQSPNAPDIAQGRYCPGKSLPKHFPHIVYMIKNHCHAIPDNVVGWGQITGASMRIHVSVISRKSEVHPLISKCFIGLFLFIYLFITLSQKFNPRDFQLFSVGNFPDTVYVNLRPGGRAVSAPDVGSWDRGFESRWRPDSSRT